MFTLVPSVQVMVREPSGCGAMLQEVPFAPLVPFVPLVPFFPLATVAEVPSEHLMVEVPSWLSVTAQEVPFDPGVPFVPAGPASPLPPLQPKARAVASAIAPSAVRPVIMPARRNMLPPACTDRRTTRGPIRK